MSRRASTRWTTEWYGRVCLEWQPNPTPYTNGTNSTICTIRPDWGMVGDNCANSERASCSAYPYSLVWTINFFPFSYIFLYSFLEKKKCQIQTSMGRLWIVETKGFLERSCCIGAFINVWSRSPFLPITSFSSISLLWLSVKFAMTTICKIHQSLEL